MCHFLPLRKGGSDFGLKTGSRGTPWNSKNAGPGGSEFTKCRFWPFIWHFGLFEGGSFFHTFFTLFNFLILSLFLFLRFLILSLFVFLCFSEFCHFFTFCRFLVKHDFLLFFRVFQFLKGYLKDKALFWPLFLTVVLSHGKHLEGVNSLCEIWALFFCRFSCFSLIFGHFWSIFTDFSILPLRNHFFWSIFDVNFWSILSDFYFFWEILTHFCDFRGGQSQTPNPINKCPFGSQKGP